MPQGSGFLKSSIGRKALMAVTGLLLIGFLIMHVSANLLILFDPEAFNAYSHKLISNPLIYIAELGLLVLFVAHLGAGIVTERRNRAARPVAYGMKQNAGHTSRKTLASSTMIFSGLLALMFVPLHIWGFKFGAYYDSTTHPGNHNQGGTWDLVRGLPRPQEELRGELHGLPRKHHGGHSALRTLPPNPTI